MARVTVEDCVEQIANRFELVSLAAQRAKSISCGSPITIERDNDKLAKNRESARNSRKRKKMYLELLEHKVTKLSQQ